MERYEKYKDSGVAWLGKIPENWKYGTLKRLATRIVVGIAEAATHAYVNEGIPILRATNIRENKIIGNILHVNTDYSRGRESKLIYSGDLVTVRTGNAGVTALIPQELDKCQCFTMLITTLKENVSNRFYCYFLNSQSAKIYFSIKGWGTAQINISVPILQNLSIPIPPLEEQKAIARYLDRKTTEIDQLIAQKERLIELYEEEKTSIINQAVTKGINLDVKLKPSGINWLGDIPEHWKVTKANYISKIFVPQRNKPTLNANHGICWLTMEDMSVNRINNTFLKVTDDAAKKAGSKILNQGAVIASCVGNFGVCTINDIDVIINQQLQAFIPNNQKIIPEYLCEIIRISSSYFEMVATAATVLYVNQSGFSNMPVLLPPLKEQKAIAEYIETETARIDAKIAKTKRIIELQKEYRTALISEAVTGKIKVPELAT
ncbi:MAG: restriction endonuclease subunit S [Xenococcus sp. MO_188.B8]|nr:restriction endonuclease subunit S [Xenococcus sp. MO_188.B8]